jgi:hypothetical protein
MTIPEAPMIFEAKKRSLPALVLAGMALTIAASAMSKQPSAQGPVWDISYTRAFPGKVNQYLEQVRLLLLPVLEEDKRQGGILDYKVLQKIDKHGADDWNIAVVVIFKNYAQMDGHHARWEAISKKLTGDRKEMDRNEMRVDVGEDFLDEIN